MICPRCGSGNADNARTCCKCGILFPVKPVTATSSAPFGFKTANDLEFENGIKHEDSLSGKHSGNSFGYTERNGMERINGTSGYNGRTTPITTSDYSGRTIDGGTTGYTKRSTMGHIERMPDKNPNVHSEEGIKKPAYKEFDIPKVGKSRKKTRAIIAFSFIAVAVLAMIVLPLTLFKSEEKPKETPETIAKAYMEGLKNKEYGECIEQMVDYRQPVKEDFKKRWEKVDIESYEIQKSESAEKIAEKINLERKEKDMDEINAENIKTIKVEYKYNNGKVENKVLKIIKETSGKWKIYEGL